MIGFVEVAIPVIVRKTWPSKFCENKKHNFFSQEELGGGGEVETPRAMLSQL